MDVVAHNRKAWNREARSGSRWSQPVDSDVIARAREGNWEVILTPNRAVPKSWFPPLEGKSLLGLASGGGQQMPILAAAGAQVTSFDNSDEQLHRDLLVADREGLQIRAVQGDMADLSEFESSIFDLIFHPCSNGFVEDVIPVWKECHRVLKPGGTLLSGFVNPVMYLTDQEEGGLEIVNKLPYSDLTHMEKGALENRIRAGEPMEFSHTLEALIGGQLKAGLVLTDLYEDDWEDDASPLNAFMPLFIATLARKPAS